MPRERSKKERHDPEHFVAAWSPEHVTADWSDYTRGSRRAAVAGRTCQPQRNYCAMDTM